jgi:hypothetical protein
MGRVLIPGGWPLCCLIFNNLRNSKYPNTTNATNPSVPPNQHPQSAHPMVLRALDSGSLYQMEAAPAEHFRHY